ncbi:hypothetical protein MKW94_004662 [Papaver nudicaule]|uniref:DUF3700 domain-containing protein n=1 Tax=Papaver nudicaule TaxID=74823 RepID=A0AA41VBD9_PAPNU|nr:hypothetical protein [Papaver nudicaule]
MLAVFDKSVAKCPEGLTSPNLDSSISALSNGDLTQHFCSLDPNTVTINLGIAGSIAYSPNKQNSLVPRLFGVVSDIFCLFQGHFENIAVLKQQYGLHKTANEVSVVIEAYRTLRDRGPYPANHVVRDLSGKFAFVIFDSSANATFIAADADGSVPFFWGTDSEGHLICSDNADVLRKGCATSFAPFPKGCFFTTSGGLQSFEHPMNELKAMPRIDSSGQVCGATYKVDIEAKKEAVMPRVGSEANWSTNY